MITIKVTIFYIIYISEVLSSYTFNRSVFFWLKLGNWVCIQQYRLSDTRLWFLESNLDCYRIIHWETVEHMIWIMILIEFWMVWVLRFEILILQILIAKTTSFLKYNLFLRVIFSKIIQNMNVKVDMTTGRGGDEFCLPHTQTWIPIKYMFPTPNPNENK